METHHLSLLSSVALLTLKNEHKRFENYNMFVSVFTSNKSQNSTGFLPAVRETRRYRVSQEALLVPRIPSLRGCLGNLAFPGNN